MSVPFTRLHMLLTFRIEHASPLGTHSNIVCFVHKDLTYLFLVALVQTSQKVTHVGTTPTYAHFTIEFLPHSLALSPICVGDLRGNTFLMNQESFISTNDVGFAFGCLHYLSPSYGLIVLYEASPTIMNLSQFQKPIHESHKPFYIVSAKSMTKRAF
ncbi:hypothetical protein HanRHA438_Chr09g0411091 [Helianthus annuus]|nr:hypothetical protein HanRHA438_Chr09g0411091 [Helianthus annuus]